MIYKISRNADAEVYLEDEDGVDYEHKRICVYFDTFISSENLVETFLSDKGLKVYKFKISENEIYDESLNDNIEDVDEDELLDDYMYVLEMYVEQIEIDESVFKYFGKNCAISV
jgi:hypothetical protein